MNIFLKLKHWQLFLLIFGIPFIYEIVTNAIKFSEITTVIITTIGGGTLISILSISCSLGWFYAMGTNLNKKLPDTIKMSLKKFKWFMFRATAPKKILSKKILPLYSIITHIYLLWNNNYPIILAK